MAMSVSALANMLGRDPTFIGRVASTLCIEATTVLAETGIGATHAARAAYARQVVMNPMATAGQAAPYLAQSTNVAPTITMEDAGITTSITDAALLSQIATSWNVLSGIDTGN